MFTKLLIANRGEIAVRIERTCRELGIRTVALYQESDQTSLHVRLADECAWLDSPGGFMDGAAILAHAQAHGAQAIHPGYGFLAEDEGFIRACESAGMVFVGPPACVVERLRNKLGTLAAAEQAGFLTLPHAERSFDVGDMDELRRAAHALGYPVVVKSSRGGRGRGERFVVGPDRLDEAVRRAQAEAHAVYGDRRVYLEKPVLPAHQIGVQILGDAHRHLVHLGEREGSAVLGNQKFMEEAPAPSLTPAQRKQLCETALALARLFDYRGLGTVDFMVDEQGRAYFTEIKARIQMDHPVTEMLMHIDLVREQLRIAAGEVLGLEQAAPSSRGCAIECRVLAVDPQDNFMPSPGRLQYVRLPAGPETRVDTYVYSGCVVPAEYDPLIAKIVVWGETRAECLQRMARALDECALTGIPTTLQFSQRMLQEPAIKEGCYTTRLLSKPLVSGGEGQARDSLRDLAVAAALLYVRSSETSRQVVPERLHSGWHRASRHLPEENKYEQVSYPY